MDEVCAAARALRTPRTVTYSPKVFIPLTKLCRDVCHYCTFARPPVRGQRAYLTREEVLAVARAVRPPAPRGALHARGQARASLSGRARRARGARLLDDARVPGPVRSSCSRRRACCHLNPGVMTRDDLAALRQVSVSQGIMLETASERLSARGRPHFGSPDKLPAARLATIDAAGREQVPFRDGDPDRHRREPGRADRGPARDPRAARAPRPRPGSDRPELPGEAGDADGRRARALARRAALVGRRGAPRAAARGARPGSTNLSYDDFPRLLEAGIDDWSGISPVTIDHVNPEAPWPELEQLGVATRAAGSSWRRGSPSTGISGRSSGSTRRCFRLRCGAPTAKGSPARTAGRRARRR